MLAHWLDEHHSGHESSIDIVDYPKERGRQAHLVSDSAKPPKQNSPSLAHVADAAVAQCKLRCAAVKGGYACAVAVAVYFFAAAGSFFASAVAHHVSAQTSMLYEKHSCIGNLRSEEEILTGSLFGAHNRSLIFLCPGEFRAR
jgi:hypothetical protein